MANEANGIATYTRTIMTLAFRVSFRFATCHPFVLGTVVFLLVLYVFFPSLFAFFVSSSPILICTTVLLGIILSYGEENNLEVRDDKDGVSGDISKDGNAGARAVLSERTVNEAAALAGGRATNNEIHLMEKSVKDGEPSRQGIKEKKFFSQQAHGAKIESGDVAGASTGDPSKDNNLKVDTGRPVLENRIKPADVCSDTSSDESSSPDASITDVTPVIDEHCPLLDADAPQPAFKSPDDSDSASSEENESDDGSIVEEENQDEEDDEDAQEEKDDGNEKLVKWTEDDQKNLMDLGTSEMERNLRLENLIAKRTARKSLIPDIVNNLIDLDSNVPLPTVEELSRFHVQIPPRRNPFDVPYDPGEAMGLPPIPGSAPSILLPRRNPFDLPFDQVDQGSGLATGAPSHPVFAPIPPKDPFFRRHESFSLGGSVPAEFKQDSRFKPYFIPDKIEEFPTLERQLSDKSDSKLSSVAESDISSSIAEEEHKEQLEEGLRHESEILSHADHDGEPIEQGSESSEEEVDSVDVDHKQSERSTGDVHGSDLSNSIVPKIIYQTNDKAHISDAAANLEVVEDKYDDSSSSSSSEMNEKDSSSSIHEGSINSEPGIVDSSKVSTDSMQIPSKPGERADDGQVVEPVYDSSPSAAEKLLEEDLFNAGSPPRPVEKNISSGGAFRSTNEDLAFSSGGLWVASPSLSSFDEIESRSRGISEIKEHDVIQVALPGPREEFVRPIALVMPRTISGRIIHPSILSSMAVESSEDSS